MGSKFNLSSRRWSAWTIAASLLTLALAGPVLADNLSCAECRLQRTNAAQAPLGAATTANTQNLNLGINIARALTPPPAIEFPSLTTLGEQKDSPWARFAQAVAGTPAAGALPHADALGGQPFSVNWDQGQELPGAFKRPWNWPKSDFNPSFDTPYYSDSAGLLNVPSSPIWNLYQMRPDVLTAPLMQMI